MDQQDIAALFLDKEAPDKIAFLGSCDSDSKKLSQVTASKDELRVGLEEFMQKNPEKYHWCFYGKILELEGIVKDLSFIDQRQKAILNAFEFLAPVARSFSTNYSDSRYLRVAVEKYKRLSQFYFFRRLELSLQGMEELAKPENPFHEGKVYPQRGSVLEKYNLVPESPVPRASPSPSPSPT